MAPTDISKHGFVDEAVLADCLADADCITQPIQAREVAVMFDAHVDDALAVLNRDPRFTCVTPGGEWRSFGRWDLDPTAPSAGGCPIHSAHDYRCIACVVAATEAELAATTEDVQ